MQFAIKSKKNPFQRAKELEEQKKKRDNEEAARVYEEFVKEFASGDDDGSRAAPPSKAFVRGGSTGGHGTPGGAGSRGGSKGRYVPSFLPPPMAAVAKGGGGREQGGRGAAAEGAGAGTASAGKPAEEQSVFQLPTKPGKTRTMDAMLERFKREQEEREARKEQGLPPLEPERGRNDLTTDASTTNLYIGNLAPDVDEHVLMKEFGRFGPIGSVKIMWPRDEEQRRRGRNNGFVSFMRREDAEKAKDALDGIILRDLMLSIGWGKPVPLPPTPCYPPPGGLAAGLEGAAVPPPSTAAATRYRRDDIATAPAPAKEVAGVGPDIPVVIPPDARQRFVIDAVAFYVTRDGCEFEQVVMEREQANPEFNFLFDVRLPEHVYYRWRLYSLACGDSLRSWRVDPFLMVDRSNRWVPPPMTVGVTGHKTRAQRGGERARGQEDVPLSDLQRDKFEDMLRTLSVEREAVCAAMVFALDNAESAGEVAEVLGDALALPETPIPLKVARLFLVSDILHNSTAPVRNASRYRARLEELLPEVFESLAEAARAAESRMAQDLLRKHVLKVLRIWRGWFIFNDDYLNGLQATFLRPPEAAAAPANEELRAELEALGDEELETKCRRAGLSRRGGHAAQVGRLLALDSYLHGDNRTLGRVGSAPRVAANPTSAWQSVDEPAEAAPAPPPPSKWEAAEPTAAAAAPPPAALRSKWEQPAAEQAPPSTAPRSKWEAEEPVGAGGQQPAPQPPGGAGREEPAAAAAAAAGGGGDGADEERRRRLRGVEVAVMQYREELEERGLSAQEVERRAVEHRAALLASSGGGGGGADRPGSRSSGRPQPQRGERKRSRSPDRGRERERERKRSRSRSPHSQGKRWR